MTDKITSELCESIIRNVGERTSHLRAISSKYFKNCCSFPITCTKDIALFQSLSDVGRPLGGCYGISPGSESTERSHFTFHPHLSLLTCCANRIGGKKSQSDERGRFLKQSEAKSMILLMKSTDCVSVRWKISFPIFSVIFFRWQGDK